MRELSPSLLAAQKSASGVPYVQVRVRERIGGVVRLAWERLYSGGEVDCFHAAAVPGDGSLVRARVEPSTSTLYTQRVAAPGPSQSFDSWSPFTAVCPATGIALAGQGAVVLLFYVAPDGVTVKVAESGDYGQTFGAPTTAATAPSAAGWLAAGLKGDGTALLLYSAGATVYAAKRVGGVWGTPAAWSNSVASVSGLACCHALDFNVVVAGTAASGAACLWTAIYGDGFNRPLDTWSGLTELTRADSGSAVAFRAPFLDRADTFRLFVVEQYGGAQAYSRPLWSHLPAAGDFATHVWREPVPFDLSSQYGVAVAHTSTHAWLSTPSGVWRAALETSYLELTDDVLEMTVECREGDGWVRLLLRNDDGRYSDLTAGPTAVIKRGSQLEVSPGCLTDEGAAVSMGPQFWIEGWEHESGGGQATLALHGRDGWWLLENWRARREYAWAVGEKSLFQLLAFVFARGGLELGAMSYSAVLTSFKPAFALHPGEDGRSAVTRLLEMAPDVIRMSGESGMLIDPSPEEEAVYSYGGDHPVWRGRYETGTPPFNRVQVFGAAAMVDAFDWPEIAHVYDRLRQEHDLNLASTGQAEQRADALMRKAAMASLSGEVVAPVNCGQELYDVITVTDAACGLSAARRRVRGLSLRYSRGGPKPVYEMKLRLGTP